MVLYRAIGGIETIYDSFVNLSDHCVWPCRVTKCWHLVLSTCKLPITTRGYLLALEHNTKFHQIDEADRALAGQIQYLAEFLNN